MNDSFRGNCFQGHAWCILSTKGVPEGWVLFSWEWIMHRVRMTVRVVLHRPLFRRTNNMHEAIVLLLLNLVSRASPLLF